MCFTEAIISLSNGPEKGKTIIPVMIIANTK